MNSNDCSFCPDSKKRKKRGIIYLSTLPKFMNVTKLRDIMSNFGEVGRIFLQPQVQTNSKKPAKHFSEGWVEFQKKRVAKEVAKGLNNKRIECRKKSQFYDFLWNIKYLSKFKWVHLSERIAYERAVRKHRMRVEIAQVKREAADFSLKINHSEKMKLKTQLHQNFDEEKIISKLPFPQKKTEAQFKKKYTLFKKDNLDVITTLFS